MLLVRQAAVNSTSFIKHYELGLVGYMAVFPEAHAVQCPDTAQLC